MPHGRSQQYVIYGTYESSTLLISSHVHVETYHRKERAAALAANLPSTTGPVAVGKENNTPPQGNST
jgi:hypothetical protein